MILMLATEKSQLATAVVVVKLNILIARGSWIYQLPLII